MNEFRVEAKRVKKGKQVQVVVYHNDVVIGARCSARPYARCLVVVKNQAWAYNHALSNAAWNLKEAIKYEAIVARQEPQYSKAVLKYGLASVQGSLVEGADGYASWAKNCRARANQWAEEAVRVNPVGGVPEDFKKPFVASFHQGKVPAPNEAHSFVAILEIPQV